MPLQDAIVGLSVGLRAITMRSEQDTAVAYLLGLGHLLAALFSFSRFPSYYRYQHDDCDNYEHAAMTTTT